MTKPLILFQALCRSLLRGLRASVPQISNLLYRRLPVGRAKQDSAVYFPPPTARARSSARIAGFSRLHHGQPTIFASFTGGAYTSAFEREAFESRSERDWTLNVERSRLVLPPSFSLQPLAFSLLLALSASAAPAPTNSLLLSRYVAIDNVCAWPNLTVLPDGTITAIIFNYPSHGQMAGDIGCWASKDGAFWEKRGRPAPNEPETARMNVAAGLAKNGDLLVLCSGWTNVKQPQRPKQGAFRDDILRNWICRSSDGGRTWKQHRDFPAPEPGWTEYIPFGDIVQGADGALHTSCYAGEWVDPATTTKTKGYRAWHFRSDDDGKSWRMTSVIGAKHNETTVFHVGGKQWLAAARIEAMDLFRSDDDGQTWGAPQRVTGRNEINGDLMRLADGRLLLSYGCRVKDRFGVIAKLSPDDGKTWSEPIPLVSDLMNTDCGYPSSVQRPDGAIVTAYYSAAAPNHQRYHMGVVIWSPPAAAK
jgi:hypothetical protein